ncbi:DEAD/DEAH box helicase family protein [Citreimonas salinaria]|uniref:Helicase/UvrB N-terminal domain-containing protein n=1 Tax=Citreimonas salinaria TaxID=321339 RepID=A0A1H3IE47_9RHOB|nr:DEAD/DEAH box helicase family protein [Citreimonas salinaria]SDY25897.1 hypothetical protein SAMN05444340_1056 [Citreimonas salinaria]
MKHEELFDATAAISPWLMPSKARALLEQEIESFVKAAAEGTAAPDAALAMKVTAGLGKTATALRVIARHGEALLGQGHVLIYVPTLDLAERAYADFRELAPGLPSRVIRGRSALRPGNSKKTMCERANLAKEISGFVPSITQALCRGQDPDGNFVQSACASGCPYLEQKDVPGPHVVFLAHAYLGVDAPIDRTYETALRVIDEKVWPTLIRRLNLSIDDFMRAPPKSFPEGLLDALTRTKAAIVDGLQRGLPLHEHLRKSGIDTAQLERLVKAEERSRSYLEIGPWQCTKTLEFCVQTFDTRSFIASRKRQQILKRVAEKETGHCVGLRLSEARTKESSQLEIQSSGFDDLDRDDPLLLLDADADPDITERVAPGAAFVSIQSPPIADIVQISDLTLSNSWLLHAEDGAERRGKVLTIIRREVEKAADGGVLVVATKSVLQALHAEVGNSAAGTEEKALRRPLLGAEPRWFGPRTQGVNDYEGFAAIVVIGRLQPGVSDIERSARAVFSKDALPIAEHVAGPLPATGATILMADGSVRDGLRRAHPDRRVQAILAQSRECATLQAIARLRLVSPNREKRVVVLSNLPLPELPVTRLCTFTALERDLEHEPDWLGFIRMEKALRATMGRAVRGARLSATGLHLDLPMDFETEPSAEGFRRGRPTSHMMLLCRRVAAANGWKITPVLLKRRSGGKAVLAIILDDHGAPLEMAETLWPDFTPNLA